MPEFKLVFSKPALSTPIFDVTHDRAEHPSGAVLDRMIVQNPPAAVILARNADGAVLLVRQYRLPLREKLWELPAGRCDPGESPIETARRELAEETGYSARTWTPLTAFHPAPGFASEKMYAFLAADLAGGEPSPEPYEVIEKRWLPWRELLAEIRDGGIRDGKTLAAILYCEAFGI